jgi:hypothetical protein
VILHAYIDETGDRGQSGKPKTSPIFGMAAVIVSDAAAARLRAVIRHLRETFRVPDGTVMSWKNHLKTHHRRQYAANSLAAVEGVTIVYVYCQKDRVSGSYVYNTERFYNYVAKMTYTNVMWAARGLDAEGIHTRFGHVRGHDHLPTKEYLQREARLDRRVPHDLERGLRWVSADRYLESQAADLYGGFLKAALWPGEFGLVEPQYIRTIWHQVRRGDEGCPVPLGFMSMPSNELARALPWNPCDCSVCNSIRVVGSPQGPIH